MNLILLKIFCNLLWWVQGLLCASQFSSGHSWAMGSWLCPWSLMVLDTVFVLNSPMYARIVGCYCLRRTGAGSTQGPSPQICAMHIFHSITPCTLSHIPHPTPQVFPANARAGTFCSELISQECHQTVLKRVFSGVGSLLLGKKIWKSCHLSMSPTQGCFPSPVSSH